MTSSGTPDKSDLAREGRRAQILDAALALFAEKGLHDTTVTEIAARAGVSQGTVYWYFDSKDELYRTAFVEKFELLLGPFYESIGDESLTAAERLVAGAEASLDLFRDNPEMAFLLMQVMASRRVAEIVAYDVTDYYRRFSDALVPLFDELGDPDPEATCVLYTALLDGLMLQRVLMPDLCPNSDVLGQIKRKFNLEEEQ